MSIKEQLDLATQLLPVAPRCPGFQGVCRPRGAFLALAFVGSIVLLFACQATAVAGSVFMKNGYIIQGPIVERSDRSIVLGWPNGKVTIQRRFIDTVSYDQGEERHLDEEEKQAHAEAAAPEEPSYLDNLNEVEDLPSDLEGLVERVLRPKNPGNPGENGGQGVLIDPATGAGGEPIEGSGAHSGVQTLLRPEEMLTERVKDARLGFSLKPPKGWGTSANGSAFQVVGEVDSNGFRPSINVVSLAKGPLSSDEYLRLLKEEDTQILEDYEVISEGPREVGSESAYELVGRGSHKGRPAQLRQVLLVRGERVWLLSAFTSSQTGGILQSQIDEALKTCEFASN